MFIFGFIVGALFGFFIISILIHNMDDEWDEVPVDLTQYSNHVYHDCTVTVIHNTVTGETSVTWYKEDV